jgi:hypothetical protein
MIGSRFVNGRGISKLKIINSSHAEAFSLNKYLKALLFPIILRGKFTNYIKVHVVCMYKAKHLSEHCQYKTPPFENHLID